MLFELQIVNRANEFLLTDEVGLVRVADDKGAITDAAELGDGAAAVLFSACVHCSVPLYR
jgi:hypothetical protein